MTKLRIVDMHELLSRSPANKQAAMVTSLKKPEYVNETAYKQHWKAPPPTFPFPPKGLINNGDKFGLFTVVGYLGSTGNRARYLVRCACGDYEARVSRELRRGASRIQHANACFNCMKWDNTKTAYNA